jgi:hypothetical protein
VTVSQHPHYRGLGIFLFTQKSDSLLSIETKQCSHAQGVTKQAEKMEKRKMPEDKKMIAVDESEY